MKKSIEEQVAELTEKQKSTIVKVGIWGTVILLIVIVPVLIISFSGLVSFITHPYTIYTGKFTSWLILTLSGCVFCLVYFVVIKVVFPYYNDRKAIYLIKNRKKNK